MLNIFFRILIAAVVAVVVSAFYAGSLKPDVIYFLGIGPLEINRMAHRPCCQMEFEMNLGFVR